MDDNSPNVQVLIPTCNNADDIEETLRSVREQDYKSENIFITVMDFGSTDGTYEKLLAFPKFHLGVYQKGRILRRKLWPSLLAQAVSYSGPAGGCLSLILYPGNVLYKNCLARCAETLNRYRGEDISQVICEADLKRDGQVVAQPPLFDLDRIMEGWNGMKEFVRRGYRHQVQCVSNGFVQRLYAPVYRNDEMSEQRWWNKCAYSNIMNMSTAIYIREPLGCQKLVEYKDELDDIWRRWAFLPAVSRAYTAALGKTIDEEFEPLGKRTLAEYAIWRSFLLSRKGPDFQKDAEDCFLISGVIDPEMKDRELYKTAERHLFQRDTASGTELEAYFEQNGMN